MQTIALRFQGSLLIILAACILLANTPASATTPLEIAQQAYLKPSVGRAFYEFGRSVAVSGNTVVVGNAAYDRQNAVYVFVRSGANWIEQARLGPGDGRSFGASVAISGDTVVVGAQTDKSNATGVNGNEADQSAPNSGAAYVYGRTGSTWTQQAYLKASNTDSNDYFGTSVAISGNTIVVGADGAASSVTGVNHPTGQTNNDYRGTGAAYVFVRAGPTWVQQAYLKASTHYPRWPGYFGTAVAVSGDTVVVGAIGEPSNSTGVDGDQSNTTAILSGAAYIFGRTGTNWTQQAYLKASNTEAGDRFGSSVAVAGDTIVVGAPGEDGSGRANDNKALDSGAAYVFVQNGTTWIQQAYLKAGYPVESDGFGESVAVSGDAVVVGASFESSVGKGVKGENGVDHTLGFGAYNSGAAYVFGRTGTTWGTPVYIKSSNSEMGDRFGSSVALSGETLVVGASGESSNSQQVNGDQCDNSASSSGASYVFDLNPTSTGTPEIVMEQPPGTVLIDGSSSVDFGDTVVGGTGKLLTFTISNTGTAPLTGTGPFFGLGINFSGISSSDFTVIVDPLDVVSWPCGSTTFTVRFAPQASGSRTAEMHIISNDGNHPSFDVALTATGRLTPAQIAQQAYLKASTPGEGNNFGYSVAVSGDTVVVGSPREGNDESGAVYVFVNRGTAWIQQAYLKASVPRPSQGFGWSVAVADNILVVGKRFDSSSATGVNGDQTSFGAFGSGAAYVFVRIGTNWTQEAYLKASNTGADDQFGHSVAVSGSTVVVGAIQEDSNTVGVDGDQANNSASNSGAAYVFVREGTNWNQQAYLKASNTQAGERFGYSLAISGETVVIGAPDESSGFAGIQNTPLGTAEQTNNNASSAGAAYVFTRTGTNWNQQAYLKPFNTDVGDQFGISVSVSAETVVVGAWNEDSAGGLNSNGTDNNASGSGAAYVFVRNGTSWSQQAFLKASNLSINDVPGDFFGGSVSVSGDRILIGASREDSNSTGVDGNGTNNNAQAAGAAYLFARTGTPPVWSQRAYLKASNTHQSDYFGWSVAVSGNTSVIGAYQESATALESGAAYVFNEAVSSIPPEAPEYTIAAFAGNGEEGFSGDGGPAIQARLGRPYGVAVNRAGNIYIADTLNSRVRLVTNGLITTFAGTGNPGISGDGGPATQAQVDQPYRMASDKAGNLYFTDTQDYRVRKVGTNGIIATFAGTGGVGSSGDGGPATQALLNTPGGLAADGSGNIYIVGREDHRVRRVDANGIITTFAGTGEPGFSGDGGPATQAKLNTPYDVAVDGANNVYIADSYNKRIRRVGTNGVIATFAGTGDAASRGDGGLAAQAAFIFPKSLAVDGIGNVYIADPNAYRIRRVDANLFISTIAGSGQLGSGGNGGSALAAQLEDLEGLAADAVGNIYLASSPNVVRVLKPAGGTIPLVPKLSSLPPAGATFNFGDSPLVGSTKSLYIGNLGTADLRIEAVGFIGDPQAFSVMVMTRDGRPVTLPHTIPTGFSDEGLDVQITGQFLDNPGDQQAELRIVSNDPAIPVADYSIRAAPFLPFGTSAEEVVIHLLNTGAGAHARRLSATSALDDPQTATLTLEPNASQLLTTEIPAFLGGGSVQLSNFTGSVTVSLHPIPNDFARKSIRVESGSFTTPSFRLPGGLETGLTRLTFGSPEQSSGILMLTNGSYTASAAATIVNNLIPNGVTVRGTYSGIYNAETGKISLQSKSKDLFEQSTQVLFGFSTEGLWLTWANTNLLEQSTDVLGPWQLITNSASPYSVLTTNHQQFFRIQQPQP